MFLTHKSYPGSNFLISLCSVLVEAGRRAASVEQFSEDIDADSDPVTSDDYLCALILHFRTMPMLKDPAAEGLDLGTFDTADTDACGGQHSRVVRVIAVADPILKRSDPDIIWPLKGADAALWDDGSLPAGVGSTLTLYDSDCITLTMLLKLWTETMD